MNHRMDRLLSRNTQHATRFELASVTHFPMLGEWKSQTMFLERDGAFSGTSET